jgi:hypothetical protein
MVVEPLMWWAAPGLGPFAYHLMLVSLGGLLVGDCLKDVLFIPRPSHPALWAKSHSGTTSAEYGMPSTHAMNAVSNSLVAVVCAVGGVAGIEPVVGPESVPALLATALLWVRVHDASGDPGRFCTTVRALVSKLSRKHQSFLGEWRRKHQMPS